MQIGPALYRRHATRAAWWAWRSSAAGIGGSQVAGLFGLSPFAPRRDGDAVPNGAEGLALEPLILRRAVAVEGLPPLDDVGPDGGCWTVEHPAHPWRRASLDGLALDGGGAPVYFAEAKAVLLGQRALWDDGLALHVEMQVLYSVALTGLPALVAALFVPAWSIPAGADLARVAALSELRVWWIDPSETPQEPAERVAPLTWGERARALLDAVDGCWARGETHLLPALVVPDPRGPLREGGADEARLLTRYLDAKTAGDLAAAEMADLRIAILAAIGEGYSGLRAGERLARVSKNGALRVR